MCLRKPVLYHQLHVSVRWNLFFFIAGQPKQLHSQMKCACAYYVGLGEYESACQCDGNENPKFVQCIS